MKKKKQLVSYNDFLNKELKDNDLALAYLKEAMADEDERVFLLALKHVLDAQGENISELAKDAKLDRAHLYKVFSKKGNPTWTTVRTILNTIGIGLQPYKK